LSRPFYFVLLSCPSLFLVFLSLFLSPYFFYFFLFLFILSFLPSNLCTSRYYVVDETGPNVSL
jgi:hypothetical protein